MSNFRRLCGLGLTREDLLILTLHYSIYYDIIFRNLLGISSGILSGILSSLVLPAAACRSGPVVPTEIWSSQFRSGGAHCTLKLAAKEGEGEAEKEAKLTAVIQYIKSNNPQLAGRWGQETYPQNPSWHWESPNARNSKSSAPPPWSSNTVADVAQL